MNKPHLLLLGPAINFQGFERLETRFVVHHQPDPAAAPDPHVAQAIEAIAVMPSRPHEPLTAEFLQRFPALAVVASLGVGYDHIDAAWAAEHGIVVTHTPDVLNEEVADLALGLLLCTVRELPQAMAYLKAGHWLQGRYPLTAASLRDRRVGLVGMGRIGQAIARRLDAFGVPIAYHTRHAQTQVRYAHYPRLLDMARDVDTLLVIVPGGASTRHLISGEVLAALGERGILINVARGSVVDTDALIHALTERRILAAGLDVYDDEPQVPDALLRLDNVVLLPHVGSASRYTAARMDELVVDNLVSWAAGQSPPTPVPETRHLTPRPPRGL